MPRPARSTRPRGPIAPTGRTLDEVYNRIPGTNGSGDGRIVIPGDGTGINLVQAGSYVLTGDFLLSTGTAINITGSFITLDLNGFTVSTLDKTKAAITLGTQATGVTVRNGRIMGGFSGVTVGTGVGTILENLQILSPRQFGISSSNPAVRDLVIRHCTIEDVGVTSSGNDAFFQVAAIYLQGPVRATIIDNVVNRLEYHGSGSPFLAGLFLNGPGTAGLMVERNRIVVPTGTLGVGILMQGAASGIARDNSIIGFSTGMTGVAAGGNGVVDGGGNVVA